MSYNCNAKRILIEKEIPYEEFLKLEKYRGKEVYIWDDDLSVPYNEYCSMELLKQKPLVTVWMITYNHESFIGQAIEGVVNQICDFPFELVIVEDHSSDQTFEICKKYQCKYPTKIRLFTSVERRPFMLARMLRGKNFFDKIFRGKYVAFCEGDDFWIYNKKLQDQVFLLEKHKDCSFCVSRVIDMDMSLKNSVKSLPRDFPKEVISSNQFLQRISLNYDFQTSTYFADKELLKLFFVNRPIFSMFMNSDVAMLRFFACNGNIAFLDKFVSIYRRRVLGSFTSRFLSKDLEEKKVFFRSMIIGSDLFDKFSNEKFHESNLIYRSQFEFKLSVLENDHINLFRKRYKRYRKEWGWNLYLYHIYGSCIEILRNIKKYFKRVFLC